MKKRSMKLSLRLLLVLMSITMLAQAILAAQVDADGNYDTSVSFDMLESWGEERVCIEYNIKIDEVESSGQWHERCVHFEPETLGGLPSVSGFATIISANDL